MRAGHDASPWASASASIAPASGACSGALAPVQGDRRSRPCVPRAAPATCARASAAAAASTRARTRRPADRCTTPLAFVALEPVLTDHHDRAGPGRATHERDRPARDDRDRARAARQVGTSASTAPGIGAGAGRVVDDRCERAVEVDREQRPRPDHGRPAPRSGRGLTARRPSVDRRLLPEDDVAVGRGVEPAGSGFDDRLDRRR